MAADDFFARWSKRKRDSAPAAMDPGVTPDADTASDSPADPQADQQTIVKPLPTQADVEGLTAESDYTAFLAKGVDESVKRSAMKKLFALPQFNIMDGLDIYVGDYSQPDPLPPGMLEALLHAKAALDPAQFFAKPVSQLLDKLEEQGSVAANPPMTTEPDPAPDASACAPDKTAPVLQQQDIQAVPQSNLAPLPDALPPAVETSKNEAV